jgi:Sel1 repeat-containing protein
MSRISHFRSINPVAHRSLRSGFRYAISSAMARAVVVAACCLVAPINLSPALADAASDRAMATRYEQSAQAGDDDAQFYLGALYSAGVGRPRSDQEAFRWFSRATDQGHSHAMLIVAGLYASGRGVAKDNVKAYSWAYIVASASKLDEDRNGARQLMSLLMNRMTSDEIGRAVVAARSWRAVRVAGAGKASGIERAADGSSDQTAPATPPPAPAVVQPAPAAAPSAAVSSAPSNIAVLPASPKATSAVTSAVPAKNAKRDDVRDLVDQVPPGLRKRFGF